VPVVASCKPCQVRDPDPDRRVRPAIVYERQLHLNQLERVGFAVSVMTFIPAC
jgi:hypothetical protein